MLALSLITPKFAISYTILAWLLAQELDINILEIEAIQVAIMH